jgi:2-oxoglutarate ferredoxin oxidoreductase subunit alpha
MTVEPKVKEVKTGTRRVVNDFSIHVATKNGSGSQTSNLTLLRALFKMGIPVSGKNLFPSNIQGLPTWYTIRVNKDGYTARSEQNEIVVAMNFDTFQQDQADVVSGGAFLYADHIKLVVTREDISVYPIPVKELVRKTDAPPRLRDYVANMVYVGVLAHILGIDLQVIEDSLEYHFRGKQRPVKLNMDMVNLAYDWTAANLEKSDPFYIEPMDATKGMLMTDGNTAGALGAVYGGVQFSSWYPITPASSLSEALTALLPDLRCATGPDNCHTYAIVQAEDELAAIGMAIGAGWAGLRSMTATSGPGISLMAEFAGLAYFTEVPVVVWDIQRAGPSTGLPTRTAQGDLNLTYFLGHGDTEHVVLLPASLNECFDFGWQAFDIAERLQTLVFVLSDLDLGMNHWMADPFEYPDKPIDRGKVLWEEDLDALKETWGRYKDVDGDGIPYRTVLGNRHIKAPYFARGTGHDEYARYSEDPIEYEENMARLKKKFETAKQFLPKPIIHEIEGAKVGILAFGSTDPAIQEGRDYLAEEGVMTDYLRVRALPFTDEIYQFLVNHDVTYVIEMNRDGQMHQLLTLAYSDLCKKMKSISKLDGLPLSANWVKNAVMAEEQK